jgi:predicted small lipoprotein YifL
MSLLLAAAALLAGCGQKGPLTLPAAVEPASSASAAR